MARGMARGQNPQKFGDFYFKILFFALNLGKVGTFAFAAVKSGSRAAMMVLCNVSLLASSLVAE